MFGNPAFLGQVPLILGPGSWGAGMIPVMVQPVPPFYGEWGTVNSDGSLLDSGRVGPFDTADAAFRSAADEAQKHGARKMPLDGFAQVKDSRGQVVGPVT